jgi:SAM-dependent methyltransferase
MLPPIVARYIAEAARVLKPGGRCVFSFFLLDNYEPGRSRPLGFARAGFNFDHQFGDWVPASPSPSQRTPRR